MQMYIWAISSMALLMLIISFLPLGYTLKGKYLIVFVSLILSLAGLAAISTFQMWQTSLMLIALIFFAAYFMNNRMETFLFKEEQVFEDRYDADFESEESDLQPFNDDNLIVTEKEIVPPFSSTTRKEKESINVLNKSPLDNQNEILADEEFSLLLERNTEEEEMNEQMGEINSENSYLSDIESLLEFELDSQKEVAVDLEEFESKEEVSLQK